MKIGNKHLLLIGGAFVAAFYALSRPKAVVATGATGQLVGLNSGVYNPIFNPAGTTNYASSFTNGTPPTGFGPVISSTYSGPPVPLSAFGTFANAFGA